MIRNFLFSLIFFTGIILISIIFLPSFFLPKQVVLIGGKLMGYWAGFCLRFILSVKISIKGKENIVTNEKFFKILFSPFNLLFAYTESIASLIPRADI